MKYFLVLLLYRLLMLILLPILLLVLMVRSINHPSYRHRLLERLGLLPNTFISNGIMVHAASVGEVIALKSFINQLIITFPSLAITVTTFTPTGSAQVKQLFGDKVQHCYLPLDVSICSWFFLQQLKPQAVIFMETELWPNIIAQCKRKHSKLLLINARLSNNSVSRYQKLTWLITPTINAFDRILTQSQINHDNFEQLGAKANKCLLTGNLKFDISINQAVMTQQTTLKKCLHGERQLWVIASTHPNDEALILAAYQQLLLTHPALLLVLVPRHPERFGAVAQLCLDHHFQIVRRSENTPVSTSTNIWLIDTLGELLAVCALADVVTMGGSFSDIGGHNPLEPALFKKPIVVGPDMSNFSEIMQQLTIAQGIIQLPSAPNMSAALQTIVARLLNNTQEQQQLGENAFSVVQNNQGASQRTLQHLQALLADQHSSG